MSEYRLRGGSVNTVVRAGDTVRRRSGGRFVHELLGAVREVRAALGWVAENRAELEGS